MSLCRLNDEVRAKIRSGIMINNVCGCVRELVYNSLDAGATQVTVKLDISKYFVQVIDNGCGINHEDMIVLGGQSFTSKWHESEKQGSIGNMGFRGEALFSICELTGTVEVCSRHQLSTETWSKLFHHGRDLGVTHSILHRKSIGTTVTLQDMFFSLPVRQKCIRESLEVEHTRQMVLQTALVNPHVSFLVENGVTGMAIIKSKKVQSVLERISHFYSPSIAKNMRILEHTIGNYRVSGYVSSEISSSKLLQLVYVNKRLVSHNQIHTLLDNLLHQPCSKERLFLQYLIAIQCPSSYCDFYYQHSKSYVDFVDWPTIVKVTTAAIKNVMSICPYNLSEGISSENDTSNNNDAGSCEITSIHFSHGMKSSRVQKVTAVTNNIGSISSSSNGHHDITAHKFIGIKTVLRSPLHTSSIAQKLTQFSDNKKLTPECAYSFSYPISDTLVSPFIPLDHSTPLQSLSSDTNVSCTHNSEITDKRSQYCSANSIGHHSKPLLAAPHLSHDTTPFVSGKRISLSLSGHQGNGGVKQLQNSNSVEKLLSEWNNPVFRTGQEHIMAMTQCHGAANHSKILCYQFTKQMFQNIRVINQVDKKFIACVMDTKCSGNHDLLVLVDQHAAHERIRLEQLTAELYSEEGYGNNLSGRQIKASVIEPAIMVHSTKNMLSAMATFYAQLKTAGIYLSEVNGLVTVNKLPAVLVNNKLPTISTAAIEEMIMGHVEHLSNTIGASHSVPRMLTDILATQSCHGAIKFNDPLTLSECQELIKSLSQCKLPFQCAHGRPSLIPLLDISKLNNN